LKRIVALATALILCLSLVACGEETVEITIPASLAGYTESNDSFDPTAYVVENGFISAVINEDTSITITMTRARHKELLAEMTAEYDEAFQEMIGAESTPYITDITHSDDFRSFVVTVERAGYENAYIELTPFLLGLSGAVYQTFAGTQPYVTISIVDNQTGEELLSQVYPAPET